jgi:hypothetical protein
MFCHQSAGRVAQNKIFSRAGLWFRDSCENGFRQDGIDNVIGIVELQAEGGDREGLEIGLERPEVEGIFFGGQEAAGAKLNAHGEQALDVAPAIGVMVAKRDFRGRRDSSGAYLGEELVWSGDTAEHNRSEGRIGDDDFPPHSPDEFPLASKFIEQRVVGRKLLG